MKKRILSLCMALFVTVSMLPARAFASPADSGTVIVTAGLCEHHTQHDESCGYSEGIGEIPCGHEHSEDCYVTAEQCVHQHDEDCGGLTDPAACTHSCSEENGCIVSTLDCQHQHDETCGYAPAVEGTPCTYECELCAAAAVNQPEEMPDADECTCTALCTEGAADASCPVCGAEEADLTACQGKAAEAVCTCAALCTEGAADASCPVCGAEEADLTACQGKAAEAVCTCAALCTEGAADASCPVCGAEGADLSACAAPVMLPLMSPRSGEESITVSETPLTSTTDNPVVYARNAGYGHEAMITTDDANENNYNVKWDGKTLTLRNATVYVERTGDLTIECIGTNKATGTPAAAIHVKGDGSCLTFTGSGSLSAEIGGTGGESAIVAEGDIIVESGTISSDHAIQARYNFIFRGGSVLTKPNTNASARKPSIQIEQDSGTIVVEPPSGKAIELVVNSYGRQYYTGKTVLPKEMFYGNEASINVTAPNIFVGDLGLNGSSGNPAYAKTDESGAVTEGSAEDYNIKWDGSILTLRNATIKSYTDLMGVKAAVRTTDIGDLTIELEGERNIIDVPEGVNGIIHNGRVFPELTFRAKEAGSILDITVGGDNAVYAEQYMTVESGTIHIDGGSESSIYCEDRLTINGGHVVIGQDKESPVGIHMGNESLAKLEINDGTLEIKEKVTTGVLTDFCFAINGGTLDIAAKETGIHLSTTGGMFFSGGNSTIHAGVTGVLNAGGHVTFENDCDVDITAKTGVDTLQNEVRFRGGSISITASGDTAVHATEVFFTDGSISITTSGDAAVRAEDACISGGEVTVTSAGSAFALTGNMTVQPPSGKNIAMENGADAATAEPVLGSPFDIDTVVSSSGAYFHSKVSEDSYEIYVGGVGFSSSPGSPVYARTDADGTVTAGGSESDYNIKWDGSTLTLRNAYITGVRVSVQEANGMLCAAAISRKGDIEIALIGENTVRTGTAVENTSSYAIYADSDNTGSDESETRVLKISGTGTLIAESSDLNISTDMSFNSAGIFAANSLIIEDGVTVKATGGEAAYNGGSSGGIFASYRGIGDVILSGDITAVGAEAGDSYGILIGDYSSGGVDITLSGTIDARSGKGNTGGSNSSYSYGIRARSVNTLNISGHITAYGGPIMTEYGNSYGLSSSGVITVEPDAYLEAHSEDANFSIGISAQDTFTINGGTVIAEPSTSDKTMGSYGISGESEIIVNDGSLTAVGSCARDTSYGIRVLGDFTVNDGFVQTDSAQVTNTEYGTDSYGITAYNIRIAGGTVNAAGVQHGLHIGYSHTPGVITIIGGKVTATASNADGQAIMAGAGSSVTVQPEADRVVEINAGESGASAAEVIGSPIGYSENGTSVTVSGRYFHSMEKQAPNIYVGGTGLYGTKDQIVYARIASDGSITEDGSANDYNIKWDGETLTLNGARITKARTTLTETAAVYREGDLKIELQGVNTITGAAAADASSYGIHVVKSITGIDTAPGDLLISGTGSLTVAAGTASGTNSDSFGIYVSGGVTVSGGSTVIANGGAADSRSMGIYAVSQIGTSGSEISVTGGKAGNISTGLGAGGAITLSGGKITASGGEALESYGIYAKTSVTIENDADVTANGGTAIDKSYGIYVSNGSVGITGSTVAATGGEAGVSCGICADTSVTVGDNASVTAAGDAAASFSCGVYIENGSMEISDGIITVNSGDVSAPEGESYGICAYNSITLSGGEVTARTGEASRSQGMYAQNGAVSVNPLNGEAVEVRTGADESTAQMIEGAPFEVRQDITGLIAGQRFVRTLAGTVYTITVEASENGTVTAPEKAVEGSTVTLTPTPDSGYRLARWEITPAVEISGNSFVMSGEPVTVKAVFEKISSSSSSSGSSSSDRKREFWEDVRDAIEDAEPGETVKAEARSNDRMPYWVMDALWEAGDITLHITWNGGEDIIIPAGAALEPEAYRIYYPLSYLAELDFTVPAEEDSTTTNPETSGILSITTPETPDEETEEITDPDRGLAETPELRDEGVEQTISGVDEPEELQQSGSILPWIAAAGILLAAGIGGFLFWKRRKKD